MKRLYLRLYLAFVAILLVSAVFAFGLRHFESSEREQRGAILRGVASLVMERLSGLHGEALERGLRAEAERLGVCLVLWTKDEEFLASSDGQPVPFPRRSHEGGFLFQGTPGLLVAVESGGWFGVLFEGHEPGIRFLGGLSVFALVLALGCYPLARGITRRLERLGDSVHRWGEGRLETRAAVEGRDEVAALAQSFNQAADRVEALVAQRTRILASASHELRSPLTRIRMALELLPSASAERRIELSRDSEADAEELDELIEDLLLAARAADPRAQLPTTELDFAEVVAGEAQRFDASVQAHGVATTLVGNERSLRRLCRNLLENAQRHAGGAQLEVVLSDSGELLRLEVLDRGPGVPDGEAERIFEPFYRPAGHAETEHGGVGLGLAFVRQVASAHGGAAGYEPRAGGGSCFWVELPRKT